MTAVVNAPNPISLNSELNLWGPNGEIQFDKDREAARQYFLQEVNPSTVFFHSHKEKLDFLLEEGYYDQEVFLQYSEEFILKAYDTAYSYKFRFKSFVGALKFYTGYALKTFDGTRWLERYEDRVVANALLLARGDESQALGIIDAIITGQLQPATPTFSNAGLRNAGEMVSCFLLDTHDSLDSIMNTVKSASNLSKMGGGVGINLTNIRAVGDPIRNVEGVASGVIPYAKVLEDTFKWINQLGQRQGACVVYIHAHHMDVLALLDSKRENADEAIRLKTLSVGITIPDITYELAAKNEDMYLFSPYDVRKVYGKEFSEVDVTEHYRELVENPAIRKTRINARKFFMTLAELRAESGYPYILNIDTANAGNPAGGTVKMSNLCSEILQPQSPSTFDDAGNYETVGQDISCNLASLNVARIMENGNVEQVVDMAVRGLTAVSDLTEIKRAPTVARANSSSHSIGLGQMNLAGFFGKEKMIYGDEDSLEFTSAYFSMINYYTLKTSNDIARERSVVFEGFTTSDYVTGRYFDMYRNTSFEPQRAKVVEVFEKYGITVPSIEDWKRLEEDVATYGLYHSHRQAVAPTGSISYLSHSTSSITPITSLVEIRKEGKMGRVYFPAPEMNNSNMEYFKDAYDLGYKAVVDVYSAAQPHVDQGMSMNLFFKQPSMKEFVNSIMYAHKKGVKTLYYARLQQQALDGVDVAECVSCTL